MTQLVRDLVAGQLEEADDDLGFDITRLNVRDHARPHTPEISEEEREALTQNPDVQLFAHVTDTIAFARQLRKDAWK